MAARADGDACQRRQRINAGLVVVVPSDSAVRSNSKSMRRPVALHAASVPPDYREKRGGETRRSVWRVPRRHVVLTDRFPEEEDHPVRRVPRQSLLTGLADCRKKSRRPGKSRILHSAQLRGVGTAALRISRKSGFRWLFTFELSCVCSACLQDHIISVCTDINSRTHEYAI
jgi:hypothetical protein